MPLVDLRSVRAKMLAWPVLTTVAALFAAAAATPLDHAAAVFAGGAVAAGLSMLASWRLHRKIIRPLHEIAHAARKVASRGDYSVRALKIADDEAGVLADAFNDMRPRGAILAPSPTWQAYTGQSDAEALGDSWMKALHSEDAGAALATWRAALVTQSVFGRQCRVRGCDGTYCWFAHAGCLCGAATARSTSG